MLHLLKEYKIDGTDQRIVINYSTECPNDQLVKPELDLNKPIHGVLRRTIPSANEVNTITFEIVLSSDNPHSRPWYIGDIPIPNIGLMIPEDSIDPQVRVLRIRDLIASNLLTDITPQVIEEPKLTLSGIEAGPAITLGPHREEWKELLGLCVTILKDYNQYPGGLTIILSDDKQRVIIKDPFHNIPDIKLPLCDPVALSDPWLIISERDLLITHNPETNGFSKRLIRFEADIKFESDSRRDRYYPDRPRHR